MAIGDYILCDECGVKLIYDQPVYTYKYYANRQWNDRFGKEPKMVCPNCTEKTNKQATLKAAQCWTTKKIHEQHTAPLIEGALSKLDFEDKK